MKFGDKLVDYAGTEYVYLGELNGQWKVVNESGQTHLKWPDDFKYDSTVKVNLETREPARLKEWARRADQYADTAHESSCYEDRDRPIIEAKALMSIASSLIVASRRLERMCAAIERLCEVADGRDNK